MIDVLCKPVFVPQIGDGAAGDGALGLVIANVSVQAPMTGAVATVVTKLSKSSLNDIIIHNIIDSYFIKSCWFKC